MSSNQDPLLPAMRGYPDLELDRGDARFQDLLDRLALPGRFS